MKKLLFATGIILMAFYAMAQISDTIPPVFHSINFTPQPVNNGDSLEIELNVTDDISGVDFIAIYFRSPSNSQNGDAQGSRWNKQNDSIYIAKIKMNDWAESGNWYVTSIYITDSANNTYTHNTTANDTIATFIVNGISSINNVEKSNDIIIYPNPAKGKIEIAGAGIRKVRIYSITGILIFESDRSEINIENMDNGTYIVVIIDENNRIETSKLIIRR